MRVMRLIVAMILAATVVSAAAHASEGAPEALPPSVRLKSLMLPVLSAQGKVEKYTQMEVTLEIADATKLGDVQVAMPKLQDAVLTELYQAIDSGWIIRGNVANAPALRKKLDEVSEKIVGKDLISRVLITPVARQSSWP